ncbi:SAF domain-containing protein [Actinokineospora sp. UTMC 2448]|uniref:SAF domain-containing protein n=1 Tax=Actinokineospora sp. UTMC 2448 TaxID=2268449 RepID=UPI002164D60A|nr:SAF domain-containing protein [Actinokineospora sp. UTMC 2448]UVS76916.1 flagellar basal body P-ring biosynthesis protein FlgA [Actinokineospora sp. UTMC 2448]
MPRAVLDRLTRPLSLRRAAAGVLVLLAAVLAFTPSARDGTAPVLVAARDLPAGAVLSAADVRSVRMPPDLVPGAALAEASEVESAVLVAAASAGEPLTRTRLLGPEHVRLAAGPGQDAVPLRLADPGVARLLRAGARVDVVAAEPHAVVARDGVVLAVHGGDSARDGPVVLLALPGDSATRVAAVALERPVGVTLR